MSTCNLGKNKFTHNTVRIMILHLPDGSKNCNGNIPTQKYSRTRKFPLKNQFK